MARSRFVSVLVVTLLAASGWSCADSIDPASNEVEGVAIIGVERNIQVGQTSQFEGRAITKAGVRVDDFIFWTVSQPGVIKVTAELVTVGQNIVNRATVTGLGEGSSDLIATAGGKTASVRIVVSSAPP
jgi:hypothetical protein